MQRIQETKEHPKGIVGLLLKCLKEQNVLISDIKVFTTKDFKVSEFEKAGFNLEPFHGKTGIYMLAVGKNEIAQSKTGNWRIVFKNYDL